MRRGVVEVKVLRARKSLIHQGGADDCEGCPQDAQLLRISVGRLEAESGQGGGNVDQPSNQSNNTTHLCPVLGRIIGTAEETTQIGRSKHAEPDDFLFTRVCGIAFGGAIQETLDCGQPFYDGQQNLIAWLHTSKRQLDYRSNRNSRRYSQREPECIFHVRFRRDMPLPYRN